MTSSIQWRVEEKCSPLLRNQNKLKKEKTKRNHEK